MSTISYEFSYVRNIDKTLPQLLGCNVDGVQYNFQLETLHLYEHFGGHEFKNSCHQHDVFHIVMHTERSQESNMNLNHKAVPVFPGMIVMIPPGVPHSFHPNNSFSDYHEITFSLIADDGTRLSNCEFSKLFKLWSGTGCRNVDYIFESSKPLYQSLQVHYGNIAKRLDKSNSGGMLQVMTAITSMMFTLMEHFSDTDVKTSADSRLDTAWVYIEDNYTAKLSLKKIARKVGMSHEYFCKRFKQEFGITPLQYRQKLRMSAAEQLLSLSELQIKEISDRLGFSDIYTFSRAFKNYTGKSPSSLKKK